MARKGSAEYKEARKVARRETFNSRSVFPKLVEAQRTQQEYGKGRRRAESVNRAYADYNEAFDAGVARRMGEDKPKAARKGRKTAHVPAGNANGGQFTGRSNPPSGGIKPKAAKKPNRSALIRKWNTKRTQYQNDKRPSAQEVAITASYLEAEARRGNGPGVQSYDDLVARYDGLVKKHKAVMKAEQPKAAPKPRARKPKASAPPTARGRVATSTPAMQRDYHQEIEYDLARALQIADESERDGSWTHAEAQKARGVAKRMATAEHKKVPGWEPPAKAAPKPRKRKASAAKRELYGGPMTEAEAQADYDAAIARYGAGLPEDAKKRLRALRDKRVRAARAYERERVPRQGKRTRRTTQEREYVYSEARRGLRNRRARGG